jgi:HD-GYP domain-containing protein (c-di-GMP phosphodiesterase class II)
MASHKLRVDMFDLVASIARIVDMMSPAVGSHHMQVAYLAHRLGEELKLSDDERFELLIAGALHDIGAFSLKDRIDLLEFEDTEPGEHSLAGSLILETFIPFSPMAQLVKFHHVPWKNGHGATQEDESVPMGSHIIHLADRVAVQISRKVPILGQVRGICDTISAQRGEIFVPEHVDALLKIATREYIWLDAVSESIEVILRRNVLHQKRELSIEELVDFSRLICRLIDFRSEFTASHSNGVAATAVQLAKLTGFSRYERSLIEIAAYLHDLGKLAIPSEIIEKQNALTEEERFIMRSHVYHTFQALEPFDMLKAVSSWGSLHQERLNGTGYPFGLMADDLPLGSRIMAVADVFTALTEDRPYRRGMNPESTTAVLQAMVEADELDKNLVDLVFKHYETMNELRDTAQKEATREYQSFQAVLHRMCKINP